MGNFRKIILITSVLFLLIFLMGCIYFYLLKPKSEKFSRPACLSDDKIVEYVIEENEDAPWNAIVSIKEKNTNKQIFEFRIENIVPNHYYPYEAHKCGIYLVREFNYDYIKGKPLPNFKMEVWRYYYDGHGEKLIEENDFRVSLDEEYIVFEESYLGKDDYALIIKNLNTLEDLFILKLEDILAEYPEVIPGNFGLGFWSDDGKYLYGDIFQGALSTAYYRIETRTWKTDIFSAPPDILAGVERSINYKKWYLAYVDIPTFTGFQEVYEQIIEEARKTGKQKNLYAYNLVTKEKIKLATADPEWRFNINWLSDTELEYELPSGEKKIYEIKE